MKMKISAIRAVCFLAIALGLPGAVINTGLLPNELHAADSSGGVCAPDNGSNCHYDWDSGMGQIHGNLVDYYCQWYWETRCETCCVDETSDCETGHGYDDDWGKCPD